LFLNVADMAAGQRPVAVLPGRQGARGSPSALHGYFHKEILTCYSDRAVQPETAMTVKAMPGRLRLRQLHRARGPMVKVLEPEFIASTAGQVAAELARRGVAPEQRVTITIEPDEPDDWIAKARKFARPKVIAEGWTDVDIDRIIKEERKAVQPLLG
jgi:hypothetical protein